MDGRLIKKLLTITHEEVEILKKTHGNTYESFQVQGNSLVEIPGLSLRKSTRYIEFKPHQHQFIEISIGLLGNLKHRVNGEPINLGVGDVLCIGAQVESHQIAVARNGDIALNFLIREDYIIDLFEEYPLEKPVVEFINALLRSPNKGFYYLRGLSPHLMARIESGLHTLYFRSHGEGAIRAILASILLELFGILYDTHSSRVGERTVSVTLESIQGYIENNYSTASLKGYADLVRGDYTTLGKVIKEKTGKNFKELVQEKRLDVATKLLTFSSHTVKDISRQVGYENYSYFYTIFSKKFAMTPVAYRKQSLGETP